MRKIPFLDLKEVNRPYFSEIEAVATELIRSGWYIRGKYCEQFESEFAKFCNVKHCVGVANGLDALSLVLKGWLELGRISEGDEVIVPANTFIASILAITQNRLVPVLVEPSEITYNLTAESISAAVTKKTRVVLPVHLYGQLAPMEEIMNIAAEHDLLVLEDAAQSHGAQVSNRFAGSIGHAGAFSFYPGKNLGALGDAGAVTTNDTKLAKVVRALGNYGSESKYEHDYAGHNSRLDELQAAFLSIKLKSLDSDTARRRAIACRYADGIHNSLIRLPLPSGLSPEDLMDHAFHLFVVRCEQRDQLQDFLAEGGVQTLIHYPIPPHKQKAYNWSSKYPLSERLHEEVLSLPMSPVHTDDQIDQVIELCNSFRVKS